MTNEHASLFRSLVFRNGLTLRNRVVMAPMTTWSADPDGAISDAELDYYRRRVQGVGMVVTGCTHVTENGIGFTDEFAAYDDRFIPSLRRLAEAAKSGGALAVLQIFHAGNKAVVEAVPNGELVSASAVAALAGPFNRGDVTPRPLASNEIEDMVRAFGDTVRRAIEAGFDGVELHGAHGFLLQNFFSPRYNRRCDEWGGSLENRMRFPLAVVSEARRVIAAYAKRPFLLGYRISPEEREEGGYRVPDVCALVDKVIEGGVDYVHASLNDVRGARPLGADTGLTVKAIVDHVGGRVPVMSAGMLRTPREAADALDLGLSLVAVGKGLVMNPDWVAIAETGCDAQIRHAIDMGEQSQLSIPEGLWAAIEMAPGWIPVHRPEAVVD
ncbi:MULTISPECIES: NADH-dependent flavin oxidoreductase [Burkholderia]|jgi:2,4-dienoyl-CoA reductase-like NADH-dependent reductase (Old Yellow Enzyme family)|uniref:NADH-dependent flavin oxidoreductase n=4 Tax=Pseudomonadota TaxID=1224 RepID=A0A1R1W0V5_9BURK|nr:MULTISPECIES: NADH-dependent flavin oxidoreductase [Burkholderia]UTP27020.1 NADH-dependent flavin oxidoreductase [Burkholderia sp. FXe9]KKL42788.1 NADH:flavin oxidoreductase [Burkholderia contaminans LMG 23361]MBA9834627.1 NADH-dependent flavin oxidoreductase [Burkholderia contaminans]MBA9842445.1 NADH-dependent flavin oxidoreductase [Burkholderia contaminans]MBA9867395.1 NADH-dependent flavin oxidoreductase [Burkholderia contaminans]